MTEVVHYSFDTQNIMRVDTVQAAKDTRLKPLAPLLTTSIFPYVVGDFPRIKSREFRYDQALHVGRLVADALFEHSPELPLTQRMVHRLDVLGVFPNFNYIRKHFGNLPQFAHEIDAYTTRPSTLFDEMSKNELIDAVLHERDSQRLATPVDSRWLLKQYNRTSLPHLTYLHRRGITISELNEHIGYPDISKWSNEDFILYGADVLLLNGPNTLTVSNAFTLAKRDLGPYPATIKSRFGSWGKYTHLVQDEYARQDALRASKINAVTKFYEANFGKSEVDFSIMARYRALYVLMNALGVKVNIPPAPTARFTTKLLDTLEEETSLTKSIMEATAVQHNIFDDIWNIRSHYIPPWL